MSFLLVYGWGDNRLPLIYLGIYFVKTTGNDLKVSKINHFFTKEGHKISIPNKKMFQKDG